MLNGKPMHIKTQKDVMVPPNTSCDDYPVWGVKAEQVMWYGGDIRNHIRERIVITKIADAATIHSIACKAADHGAVALFAPIRPYGIFYTTITCVCLDESELRKVIQCFSVYVDLEPCQTYAGAINKRHNARNLRRRRRSFQRCGVR